MGKIFKKVVCLLLGAILGISAILATVVTAGYYMYSEVPVANIVMDVTGNTDAKEDLGQLGDFSVEDILDLLEQGKIAPENYTIADLKEKYGFDLIGLLNSLSKGDKPLIDENDKQFIADLEAVSLFTLFSEEGLMKFLSDLPVGAVLGFIPEETLLSQAERDKLRSYSVGRLLAKDEVTGQLGIISAISEIKVGGVLPSLFDYVGDGEYQAKDSSNGVLNLIANVEFGALINVLFGKTTVGDEFVEGGLSSIGEMTVGELLGSVLGEESNLANKMDSLLNGIQFKDLFEKDLATGSYKFVIDNLLNNVQLGVILGYEKDEEGNWLKKDETGELVPVSGLMESIASLDLTTLYHVITSDSPVGEKIHDALSNTKLGDVTVGGVFELLGYTEVDGQWQDKSGKPVAKILEVIFSISIKDIIGEESSELSPDAIRKNLVNTLIENSADLTLGEGLGELLGVELSEDGKFVHTKGDKAGEEVNSFLQNLLQVQMADLLEGFAGEKVDFNSVLKVLEGALAGATVGELVGAEKEDDGKWYKDGTEVSKVASLLYDMNFGGLFAALRQLGSEGFSYASIIEGLLPDLTVGDIATLFVKDLLAEDKGTYVQYYTKNRDVEPGFNTLLNLKIWEIAAGFDANHPYDLKKVIKDIPLGEVFNRQRQADGSWKISDKIIVKGAIAEMLDIKFTIFLARHPTDPPRTA